MNRRDLLRTAPFLLAGSLGTHLGARAGRSETEGVSRMRIAICAYSFRTPLGSKALTYADLVHMAVEQEIDGLDLTVYWFPNIEDRFLLPLKRLAYRNAVEIYSISIRTNLCRPTPREQTRELQEIRKWIEVAHKLGAGHIRIFGGDAPPGASLDKAADWAASVLGRAAEESGKRGVILGLENHGGITARAETMIGILERVDSPCAGINLDTGNFLQDPYGQIEACAPYAVNVQVKTRVVAPGGKPVPADWGRILQTLAAAGYKGYLALEYEGEEDPVTAVPRYLRELKALVARYGA